MTTKSKVGSKTYQIFERFGFLRMIIWAITQIITGQSWVTYLVTHKIIVLPTLQSLIDGTFLAQNGKGLLIVAVGEFLFGWIGYLIITFVLEGKFMDWMIKFGAFMRIKWDMWRLGLTGREITADRKALADSLSDELFDLGTMFYVAFCAFMTYWDWKLASQTKMDLADTFSAKVLVGCLYVIYCLAGEFVLYMQSEDKLEEERNIPPVSPTITAAPSTENPKS